VYDDSLIILTADHGENVGEHHLMDHQYCLYDTLVKIPLVIKFPNFQYRGKKINKLVESIDIFPSAIKFLIGKDIRCTGESLLPNDIINRKDNYAYAEYLEPQPSIEKMMEKYDCQRIKKFDRKLRAIRTENYKFILSSKGEKELYDIKRDPHENFNLASKETKLIAELEALIYAKLGEFKVREIDTEERLNDDIKKRLERLGYI
jgi:arylsulfatase A-like enzyme